MTTPIRTRPRRPLSIRGQTAIIALFIFIYSISSANGFAIQFKPVAIDDLKSATRVQYDHLRRIAVMAQCGRPRERVIHMTDLVTDPGARFIPECTTLHRCEADTGCCPSGYVCQPKSVEDVTLVFQVYRMNPNALPKITTEAFEFKNHTECGCVEKNDIPK